MSRHHLVFVVNPYSGKMRDKNIEPYINRYLNAALFSYEIAYTKGPRDGTRIASEAAANGAYGVVAVGGDGSVNDVATGLVHTATRMAIMPLGSGNGLARALHIPIGIAPSIEVINNNHVIHMDVGQANDFYFVSNAGVGFDAFVMQRYEGNATRGFWPYAQIVTQALFDYKPTAVTIEVNGKTLHEEVFLVSVANGSEYGYNFSITKHANVEDGLLEVLILKKMPFVYLPQLVNLSFHGTLHNSYYAIYERCTALTISHPHLNSFQVDGEYKSCEGIVNIKVLPAALQMIC